MKRVALLSAIFAYFGDAKADERRGHPYVVQDGVYDFLDHPGRDAPPPNGGPYSVVQANHFIDFVFLVEKRAITNRELPVNVTKGGLGNFETAMRLLGDYEPREEAGNTSITCRLNFDGIAADIFTVTKGDNLLGTVKSVTVEALVRNTTGVFDFTKAPNRPGYVRTFVVPHVDFDVMPGDNLVLNATRITDFGTYIASYPRQELYSNLYGSYKRMLDFAFGPMTQ